MMAAANSTISYEQLAGRLIANARDLIYRYRVYPEPGFDYVSPSSTSMIGYSPEEHYADPMLGFKIVHPDDRHLLNHLACADMAPNPLLLRWISKNGVVVWTEQYNTYIYEEGQLVAIEGMARDISDRKMIEDNLLLLKGALEHSSNAIFLTDQHGRKVLFANRAFSDWLQYESFSLNFYGGAAHLFYSREEALKIYDAVIRGSTWGGEVLLRSSGDKPVSVYLKGDAVYGADGQLIGLFGVCTDLSEIKEKEKALRNSEKQLAEIIRSLPDATLVIDNHGKVLAWNKAMENMTGIASQDMIGKDNFEYSLPFYGKRRPLLIDQVLKRMPEVEGSYIDLHKENTIYTGEADTATIRGRNVILRATACALFDSDGNPTGAIQSIRDITELRNTQHSLSQTRQLVNDIMDFLPDILIAIDMEGRVIFWNQAAEKVTGVEACDMLGKGDYEYSLPFYGVRQPMLFDLIVNSNLPKAHSCGSDIYGENSNLYCESYSPLLGRHFAVAASPLKNAGGEVTGAIQLLRDNTLQKKAEQEINFMSKYDGLTRIYNRSFFESAVEIRNNQTGVTGLIICDVDGLKLVNDTLGHVAGDRILIEAAQLIKENFRPDDVIARVGGDEFAVILADIDLEHLEETVKRLKNRLKDYNSQNPGIPLSISVGYSWGAEDVHKLIRQADNNMYREKLNRKTSAKGSIIQALIKTQEARDRTTGSHSERILHLTTHLADKVGYPKDRMNDLLLFTRFHDIGKVGVPDHILLKPGLLDPEERREMQRHSEIGYNIALSSADMVPIAQWILHHHEWWDGSGYPRGIAGEAIPFECRLLAVVDSYDAMISERPYRSPMSHEEAIAELRKCAGSQFDQKLVDAFCNLGQYYARE